MAAARRSPRVSTTTAAGAPPDHSDATRRSDLSFGRNTAFKRSPPKSISTASRNPRSPGRGDRIASTSGTTLRVPANRRWSNQAGATVSGANFNLGITTGARGDHVRHHRPPRVAGRSVHQERAQRPGDRTRVGPHAVMVGGGGSSAKPTARPIRVNTDGSAGSPPHAVTRMRVRARAGRRDPFISPP